MHYRKQIREAMKAALLGQTDAGANVFTTRARPVLEVLQKREMVLSVYTADERSERDGTGYNLNRTLTLSIEGMAGGGDDLDDILDLLAEQVEAVAFANKTLSNLLAEDLVLESTTMEISARGNMQVGAFRMDFSTMYQTPLIVEQPGVLPDTVYVNPAPNNDRYAGLFGPGPSVGCDDGVCNPPFYGGDLTDENLVVPLDGQP